MKEVVLTLEMQEFITVSLWPNQPTIMYEVKPRTKPEADFSDLHTTLREKLISTPHVTVYCRTLTLCTDLFAHFSYEMSTDLYYPPGSPELSDSNVFGMFHASTPQHSEDVIVNSLMDPCGGVRIVFASIAIGMGVDLQEVNAIIHYEAPSSSEDYFQASGQAGRKGDSTHSIVYWTPTDCPRRKDSCISHHHKVNDVGLTLKI